MSMTAPAVGSPRGISFEDFLATIDEDTLLEWVDGEVLAVNPPAKDHIQVTNFLVRALGEYVDQKGIGGVVLHTPLQMKLASSSRQPDLVYLREENLDRWKEHFVEGPADLAIEVISPESRARDRAEKFREYQRGGVREYWLIDPRQRTAEGYRLSQDGAYERISAGDPPRLRSEVIPGLWIDPAWLWAPRPSVRAALAEWGL
jgi:Uma2 family endonuclease